MKTLGGLVPFAVALAAGGLAIAWLLGREIGLGRWLLAGFVAAHGLIHLLFVVPQPASAATADGTEWPFDLARSWLVTGGGLDAGPVRVIGVALIAVVVAGFVLAGLATAGILVPAAWWPFAILGSAGASALLLVLFFNPILILGVSIDAILAWLVMASVWAPATAGPAA